MSAMHEGVMARGGIPPGRSKWMCQEYVISVVAISPKARTVDLDTLVCAGEGAPGRLIQAWRDECVLLDMLPVKAVVLTKEQQFVWRWDDNAAKVRNAYWIMQSANGGAVV